MRRADDDRLGKALREHNESLRKARSVDAPARPKREPRRMPVAREITRDAPWRLDLSDQEAERIQRNNPYLWRQLIDRGFIEANGLASDRWRDDPRNIVR